MPKYFYLKIAEQSLQYEFFEKNQAPVPKAYQQMNNAHPHFDDLIASIKSSKHYDAKTKDAIFEAIKRGHVHFHESPITSYFRVKVLSPEEAVRQKKIDEIFQR